MIKAGCTRREFIRRAISLFGLVMLGGFFGRIFLRRENAEAEFDQPKRRYGWQINSEKCQFCGKCETACVRKPSAVKSINDPLKCSNCVICYGFTSERHIASELIDADAARICPYNAIRRSNFSGGKDGVFIYNIDQKKCRGCGRCAKECNSHGSKSMFLIIRPDLCLGCNDCSIARACPNHAVERIPLVCATDRRFEFLNDNSIVADEFSSDQNVSKRKL